jgi:hypothetical protein
VEEIERLAAHAVHLVDEGEDGNAAAAADGEELAGLRLHALGAVDQHHRRVGGRQRPVGVLGEVLVARRVEQVDAVSVVLELQHAGGDADAALPLQLHPVAGDVPLLPARLDRAGQVDGAAVEQQLLRQRRLAGVGVRDDRERPPPRRLLPQFL